MKKALLLAACLLAASLAGCGKEQSELYDRGMDAMEQQDYVTAIGMFQGAIEAEERLAEGYRAIGIAYLESAEYESAAEAFQNSRNAMEHKNEEFQKDVMMYQAQALQLAGNTDQALEIYDQVVEAFPDGDVYLSRGSLHLTRKEYDGAKEDFEKALNENRSYEMCLKIYQLYQDSSMKADGDAFLEQATQISPNDAEDYYELGCVYYYLEDTEKAKEVLEQAMDEGSTEALSLLGNVYLDQNDTESARKLFEQELEGEEKAAAQNGLALCDIAEENYDAALEHIESGLEEASGQDRENLLFNQIVVYEKKLDFAQAKTLMTSFLEEFPDNEAAVRENQFLQSR